MKAIRTCLTLLLTSFLAHSSFAVVMFDSVSGIQSSNYIMVDWQTSSELNNDYFTLERSLDSINYTTVGSVVGIGNSSMINRYSYTDSSVTSGQTYYYRIKQTDLDGSFSYSDTIRMSVDISSQVSTLPSFDVQLYPNPSTNDFHLILDGSNNLPCSIKIFDSKGRLVRSIYGVISNEVVIPRQDLENGIYFLRIFTDNQTVLSEKLILE